MADRIITQASTNISILMRLFDATTGAPYTGATITNLRMAIYTLDTNAVTQVQDETTVLTALAAITTVHTPNYGIEIDASSSGWYRFDLPNTAVDAAATSAIIIITETSGLILEASYEIQLEPVPANLKQIQGTAQRATDLAEIAQYLIANTATFTDIIADDSILAKLLATDGDISGFDEATDSLQAIRDAIGVVSGPGAYVHTLTIRTTGATLLDSVEVWVNNSNDSSGSLIAPKYTNENGVVTVNLDYGTYYIFCRKSGYSFSVTGTNHQIISSAGAVTFTLDIATAVTTEGSNTYTSESFLTRAIAETRRNIDEPELNAKYTDTILVGMLEKSYARTIGEIQRLKANPIVATYDVTVVASTYKYLLPYNISSIYGIYQESDTGARIFYSANSRNNPRGRGVWVEGNTLNLQQNILNAGDVLTVEYISNGTPKLVNGVCTVSNSTTVVLPASPLAGTLDTHSNAYLGCILRILRDTDSSYDYIQERIITGYENTTRTATLNLALSPDSSSSSGTIYFEIAPKIHIGLDEVVAQYLAYWIASIEGNRQRSALLLGMYRDAMRTVRLDAYYSNLDEAGKWKGDNYNNRRFSGGMRT